jgi:hypothetical protein
VWAAPSIRCSDPEIDEASSEARNATRLATSSGVMAVPSGWFSSNSPMIEFKYQNVSAAMLDLGLPYIRGYKPRSNYQAALTAEIQRRLEADPTLLGRLRERHDDGALRQGRLQRTEVPEPSAPPSRFIPRDTQPLRTPPRLRARA